jgi:hypothetical protein
MSRAQLLALVDQAAADPSSARRLLERAQFLVDQELRTAKLPPDGYVYAGAHTLVAKFDTLEVEDLPDPNDPRIRPLSQTTNDPEEIKIPFDMLIQGVSAWAIPELPTSIDATQLQGVLQMGVAPDGRDLFSLAWGLDGDNLYCTDGWKSHLLPAGCMVGTRANPRPLAWMPGRGRILNVWARNLTNAICPTAYASEIDIGWPLSVTVEFHGVKLEAAR